MLNTNLYSEQILSLYNEGKTGKEIQLALGFKNHQPVYNFLRKHGLPNNQRSYKRLYTLNEHYFDKIDTEAKAYILGFICADGHVAENRICIELAQQDLDILNKISNCLNSNSPIKEFLVENPYKFSSRKLLGKAKISFNSKYMVSVLRQYGLQSSKTYSLNSSVLKVVPKKLIRHFLRGYFDGNGNVMFGKRYASGKKYNVNVCGNQEFLLNTFQKYFPSNNKMYYDKKSVQCYVWKISSKDKVIEFLNYLYENATIYLNRKYNIYLSAHVKQGELLETPIIKDNQQPS